MCNAVVSYSWVIACTHRRAMLDAGVRISITNRKLNIAGVDTNC
jgi:glycyl-tRNA synthetase alpha subunit